MKSPFKAGDVLRDGEGKVAKILVVEDAAGALHVRFYDGEYANAEAVLAALAAKKLAWTIGHVPMSAEAFDAQTYTRVTNQPVTDDELEGYRYYVQAMRGEEGASQAAKPKDEGLLARFWRAFGGNA